MKASDAIGRLIKVEKRRGMDYREAACDYVRRACLVVAEHVGEWMPDEVYADPPGEVVIRLPLDGVATIEVSTETLLLEDQSSQ